MNEKGGPMLPPARRPYKRISPLEWEEQKDQIRTLYIDQDQSITEVADTMKDKYDFNAGEKQFKRKVDEWGFTKNITNREMVKMVRKRKRREEVLGRGTVFKRSRNRVDFEVGASEKLDRFQKRNGLEDVESGTESSSMPSNIMYGTPSSNSMVQSTSKAASIAVSRYQTPIGEMESMAGTNESFQQILKVAFSESPISTSIGAQRRLGRDGPHLVFQERYDEARKAFEEDAAKAVAWRGKRHWITVNLQHTAAIMEAASHPGCPQTLSLRFIQLLSRRLMIEQQTYLASPLSENFIEELRRIITGLVDTTRNWTEIITFQKALEIWQPILGSDSLELTLLRNRLEDHKQIPCIAVENVVWDVDTPGRLFPSIQLFLHHHGEGPADKLLDLAPLLEICTGNLSSKIKDKMVLQRRGRSHAFIGGYYSFLGHFEKAEHVFQESLKTLEAETCVEIKLHRMLCHCEHYTRVKNWDRVYLLLHEAHRVFMAQETASTFVLSHFPDRFRLLCKAISACVPIDEVVHDIAMYNRDDHRNSRAQSNQLETPGMPSPVLEVERLFPLGSTDHSNIDIDAWRQYVMFSSQAGSLIRSPRTEPMYLPPHISAR